MFSMSLTMLVGVSCVSLVVVLIACSRYREWLSFLLAGMGFWLVLEFAAYGLRLMFDLQWLNSYAMAFLVFLGLVTIMLAIHDNKVAKQAQTPQYIEHTPLCEDEPPQSTLKY